MGRARTRWIRNPENLRLPICNCRLKNHLARFSIRKSAIVNRKSYELPISTPVTNTSTPPSPTCSAAVTHGVSM